MSCQLGSWGCGRSMPTWNTPAAPTQVLWWWAGEDQATLAPDAVCGIALVEYVRSHASPGRALSTLLRGVAWSIAVIASCVYHPCLCLAPALQPESMAVWC
jgi:hypothetical protein